MKISSDYALLDVTEGRKKLFKHFKGSPSMGATPMKYRIPVTITGYIDGVHSSDDGVSQEFLITVERVVVGEVAK